MLWAPEIPSRESDVVWSHRFWTARVVPNHPLIILIPVPQVSDMYCQVRTRGSRSAGTKQNKEAPSIKHEHSISDTQELEKVKATFWATGETAKEFCSQASILKIRLPKKNKLSVRHTRWDSRSVSGSGWPDCSVFPFVFCLTQRRRYMTFPLLIK